MADTTNTAITNAFLKPIDPAATTWSDPINYEAMRNAVTTSAAATKNVQGPADISGLVGTATSKKTGILGPTEKAMVGALGEQYKTQAASTKQQAAKAGTALEMMGASTEASMQYLAKLQGQIPTQVQNASDIWKEAVGKADEYVQASRARAATMLDKIDTINKQIGLTRDFTKANDMQVAVQSTLGSLKEEERNIAERYGVSSPEYNAFKNTKMMSLATVQSNIHANYSKLQETQDQTYLNATNEAMYRGNMFINFEEQTHVETLRYYAQQDSAYQLQATQLQVSIEQLRDTGMENLANWLVQTPTFSMDVTPYITAIGNIVSTKAAQIQAAQLAAKGTGTEYANRWWASPAAQGWDWSGKVNPYTGMTNFA